MKSIIVEILKSKRVWATSATILAYVLGRFKLDVPAEDLEPLLYAVGALVLSFVAPAVKHKLSSGKEE